ncbi:MAG: glucuronate isomerase, partial [Spirochaetia bacterium]|nr:glucuronate isomerase [Spirochaetia bacterium]
AIRDGKAPIGAIPTKVLPSFRPDKAILIGNSEFPQYIETLSLSVAMSINSVSDLLLALSKRVEIFIKTGCKATDHGLPMVPFELLSDKEIEEAFQKRMNGETLSKREEEAFSTKVLLFLAKEYHTHGIVMQLHVNAIRNLNPPAFNTLGPDTGYDASHDLSVAQKLSLFLGSLEKDHSLPKTILYSLNPKDYYSMGSIMGAFQGDGIKGKIQLGSAWWFCDHKEGMIEQMTTLANLGSLPRFIGMLTDSRSFLSYPRHEYFRRLLANLLGSWVENGEIPHDPVLLDNVMRDISFRNAKEYFGL